MKSNENYAASYTSAVRFLYSRFGDRISFDERIAEKELILGRVAQTLDRGRQRAKHDLRNVKGLRVPRSGHPLGYGAGLTVPDPGLCLRPLMSS